MAMISLKEVIQDSFSRLAEKSCLLSLIKKLQHRTQIRQGYDPNISLFLVCPYLRQTRPSSTEISLLFLRSPKYCQRIFLFTFQDRKAKMTENYE